MPIANVTSKGQITIPIETQTRLRLVRGTKISFDQNAAGETVMRPKTGDIRALRGILKYDGSPVSIEEMNEAIGRAIVESCKRSISRLRSIRTSCRDISSKMMRNKRR